MNRRQLLFSLAGVTLTGGSAWVATQGLSAGSGLPVQIETVDARGSNQGTTSVPVEDRVTVIDLFATWCSPCKAQMDMLAPVYESYADNDRVTFVSVTNERTGGTLSLDDIRDWWRRNDGHWTLGLDPESDLMRILRANGFPYTAIAAADGTITWREKGITKTDTLRSEIESALDR